MREVSLVLEYSWAAAALAVAALCSVSDIRRGIIPNRLTLPLLALGLALSIFRGWPGMVWSLAGGVLAGAMMCLPGLRGYGGDVKLAAGLGLWLGTWRLPEFLMVLVVVLGACQVAVRLHQARFNPVRAIGLIGLETARQIPPVRLPGAPLLLVAAVVAAL